MTSEGEDAPPGSREGGGGRRSLLVVVVMLLLLAGCRPSSGRLTAPHMNNAFSAARKIRLVLEELEHPRNILHRK